MLLTVAPPVCMAKYSTTKNTGHRQTTDGNGSSLKLNSVNAVELKISDLNNITILSKHTLTICALNLR